MVWGIGLCGRVVALFRVLVLGWVWFGAWRWVWVWDASWVVTRCVLPIDRGVGGLESIEGYFGCEEECLGEV